MCRFATLEFIEEFDKVVYYSVMLSENESSQSLYEEFINNHTDSNKEKLNFILEWIKQIGDKFGATDILFRHEKNADALPPPNSQNGKITYIKNGNDTNDLRLYCKRLNESVVILFSGDIKTTEKAQHCPNVGKHFILANELSKAIDEYMIAKDIEWTEDYRDILFDDNLKVEY